MKLNDYYKDKFNMGLEYQDFVKEILIKEIGIPITLYQSRKKQLKGESYQGIEIKYLSKMTEYNSLYFEIAEKSKKENQNYVVSGIYRDDNTWLYITGDYKIIYIFSKKYLIMLHKKNIYKEMEIQNKTSKGFIMSLNEAEKYCIKKIYITNKLDKTE